MRDLNDVRGVIGQVALSAWGLCVFGLFILVVSVLFAIGCMLFPLSSVWLVWEKANARCCQNCLAPKSNAGRRCIKCQRATDDARWAAELRANRTAEGREERA